MSLTHSVDRACRVLAESALGERGLITAERVEFLSGEIRDTIISFLEQHKAGPNPMRTEDDPPYITIQPTTTNPKLFNVVVMRLDKRFGEYMADRTSQPLSESAASHLAASWAAAGHMEIR